MSQKIRRFPLPLRRAAAAVALLVLALALFGPPRTARAADSLSFATLGSAGSGIGQLSGPRGVAVDSSGNIYVTDTGNNRLQKYSPTSTSWVVFGENDISSSVASLQGILSTGDHGKIYVTYVGANMLFGKLLVYSNYMRSGTYGIDWPAYGLSFDPTDLTSSNIYITTYLQDADFVDGTVLEKNINSESFGDFYGSVIPSKAIAINSNKDLYLVQHLDDPATDTIIKYTYDTSSADWKWSETLGSHGTGVGEFSDPHSIAVDTAGNLYVADTGNNRIQIYDVNTNTWTAWGGTSTGTTAGKFNAPQGIAVGSDGIVYVADTGNNRIQVGAASSPTATLVNAPASSTAKTSYSLTVTGTNVSNYKYSLDSSSWSGSTQTADPITLSGLSQGLHTLKLIGGNVQGYWQAEGSATVYYWTIKSKAQAVISNPPASVTALTNFSLTIGGTDVTQYRYHLDTDDWSAAATGPISLSSLALGSHTLYVIGGDSESVWQDTASPTTATWEIRATPQATITNPPASATTLTSFSVTIAGDNVTQYKYHLDSNDWSAASDVTTPISLSGMSSGAHTLYVLGSDGTLWQDAASPTSATWTVNPPVAALTNAPGSPTTDRSYSLIVGGSNVSQYKYRLDSGAWSVATDIATPITLASLDIGSHNLSIVGGNDVLWQDTASPSAYAWVIKAMPANVAVMLLLQ